MNGTTEQPAGPVLNQEPWQPFEKDIQTKTATRRSPICLA
jgi:hypothetical protein